MKLEEFLATPTSSTALLGSMKQYPYTLTVLYNASNLQGGLYQRIVAISLASKPIMLGVSTIEPKNQFFVNLCKRMKTEPIGSRLFDERSSIARHIVTVKAINSDLLLNKMLNGTSAHDIFMAHSIMQCVNSASVTDVLTTTNDKNTNAVNNILYYRKSCFVKNKECLWLEEYILPQTTDFLASL